MTLLNKLEMIERIDGLVRRKSTGTPKHLASRLNISERCLFKTLKLMKEMGAPLYYCIARETYVYEYEVSYTIGFQRSSSALNKVVGGMRNFILTAPNVHYNNLSYK